MITPASVSFNPWETTARGCRSVRRRGPCGCRSRAFGKSDRVGGADAEKEAADEECFSLPSRTATSSRWFDRWSCTTRLNALNLPKRVPPPGNQSQLSSLTIQGVRHVQNAQTTLAAAIRSRCGRVRPAHRRNRDGDCCGALRFQWFHWQQLWRGHEYGDGLRVKRFWRRQRWRRW
jgi:hypothetical protein